VLKKIITIIKCLPSPKFNSNTSTLVIVIIAKATAVIIYGFSVKSTLRKLKLMIRIAFGAFRTTPAENTYRKHM